MKDKKTKDKLKMCIIHCWCKLTYENPRGLSIYDLFTNFSA